jgi:hypothetical protein
MSYNSDAVPKDIEEYPKNFVIVLFPPVLRIKIPTRMKARLLTA